MGCEVTKTDEMTEHQQQACVSKLLVATRLFRGVQHIKVRINFRSCTRYKHTMRSLLDANSDQMRVRINTDASGKDCFSALGCDSLLNTQLLIYDGPELPKQYN